jgi:two-component sensor histidine kinase
MSEPAGPVHPGSATGARGSGRKRSPPTTVEGYEGIDLRQLLDALEAMRGGDFSVRLSGNRTGIGAKIADAFNDIAAANHNIAEVTIAAASGDLSKKISIDMCDKVPQLKKAINTMVDQLSASASQVTRVAFEVDHRVRNALANVQAIMRLTRADTLEEYSSKIERRVHALTRTHELLSKARWQGVDICLLARDELAPYKQERVSISGPSVILSPEKALSVALTLNELTTNAVKHGALSSGNGRVDVEWALEQSVLNLDWQETGGPPVSMPTHTGLGMRIIQINLNAEKGDTATFDWNPAGLHCRLRIQCGVPPFPSCS